MSGVKVTLQPGESQEKLLKRFNKKCRKEDVIRDYLDRVSFHRSKSEKKRFKRRKNFYRNKK